jgi:hypothetical protein
MLVCYPNPTAKNFPPDKQSGAAQPETIVPEVVGLPHARRSRRAPMQGARLRHPPTNGPTLMSHKKRPSSAREQRRQTRAAPRGPRGAACFPGGGARKAGTDAGAAPARHRERESGRPPRRARRTPQLIQLVPVHLTFLPSPKPPARPTTASSGA